MTRYYTAEMKSLNVVCMAFMVWTTPFTILMAGLLYFRVSESILFWSMIVSGLFLYPILVYSERTIYPDGIKDGVLQ